MVIEEKGSDSGRPLRLGMVGGGKDAFIGSVHRIAARLDGCFELVAGALSSTPEKAMESGRSLGLKEDRIYASFEDMAKREARLKDGIDAVVIVTPNHVHFPAAKAFLKRDINVICDKPLTSTVADANKFAKAVATSNGLFFLTHNYTGYPMVRQAREMVEGGELGTLRVIQVEYSQDWLTVEQHNKQAEWRTDPARSGVGGSTGDIGTHAYNLACFISGLTAESLAADLQSFVPGREVDDNGHVMLRFVGGARGMLWCSQVAPGNENNLKIRIYGDRGGLEWHQENPNHLHVTTFGEVTRLVTRGGAGMSETVGWGTRLPAGHPEGYLEGFANIYREAADQIRLHQAGQVGSSLLPGIEDGVRGVRFVDACVRSSARNATWVKLT